ncbi:MAG: hypothetical protein JXB10_05060 [Pirellulales bacterium]|nr:hypothetical protein [Pirellulales bacterium]
MERYTRAALQKRVSAAEEPPRPPRWPMLGGVWTFPFYLNTLGPWMFISFGLMLTAWVILLWLGPGMILGTMSARLFGLPACLLGALTFGYAFSCCLVVIEQTSNGWDSIDVSVGMEWKEWIWNLGRVTALLLQAAVVGYALQLLSLSETWLPMAWGTFAAFPLVLLGALASDGAWAPLAVATVLRSLIPLSWAWALFYLQTAAVAWGWTVLTVAGLEQSPGLTPLYAAPLLAAAILIYARLAGRLAGYIAEATTYFSTEGEEDDDDDE